MSSPPADSANSGEWTAAKSKKAILDKILEAHSSGSFATSHTFDSYVPPGICFDGVDDVQTPLSSQIAQALVQTCRKAPFGKGSQTLVDEAVKKAWEINGNRVSFLNSAWHSWFQSVVRTVAKDLGVAGGPDRVQAELYRMSLCDEGVIFKPPRETEKEPATFGTLVICLPSKHAGGAVRLRHGQKEMTFTTAEMSAFDITYIAWYADVLHEIEPIQSGYRWVLTYNLVHTRSIFSQSAAGLDAQMNSFVQALRKWHSLGKKDVPQYLCYVLDHLYTEDRLKLASLKGDDYCRVRHVSEASQIAGEFYVLLANMERHVPIPTEDRPMDEKKPRLTLEHVVGLDSMEAFSSPSSLSIDEDCLLQQGIYKTRNLNSQSGGGYLGNDYANSDQAYSGSVMIIMKKATVINFFFRPSGGTSFDALLQRLQESFKKRQNDPNIRELIVQTCQDRLSRGHLQKLGLIAVAAMLINDQALFTDIVGLVPQGSDMKCSKKKDSEKKDSGGEGSDEEDSDRKDCDRDDDYNEKGFNEKTFFALGEFICVPLPVVLEPSILKVLFIIPKLNRVYRCLQAFHSGFLKRNASGNDERKKQRFYSWIRDRVYQTLDFAPEAHPKDVAVLIDIVKEYDDQMFEDFVKPFIARFIGNSAFSNALAVEILSYSQGSDHEPGVVNRILPLILDAAVSLFELRNYSSASKDSSFHTDYPYSSWPSCDSSEKGQRDASLIVDLYRRLLQSDEKRACELLIKIQLQVEYISLNEMDRFVFSLLEQMMHIVETYSPDYCQFVLLIMTTYLMRVVRKEPEIPEDWSRPNRKICCDRSDCQFCPSLQDFLMDPREESHEFFMDESDHKSHVNFFRWNMRTTEYEVHINRSKNPQVLTITKITEAWENAHKRWQKRASMAQESIKLLPQPALRQCLGDRFESIVDLHIIKALHRGSSDDTPELWDIEHENLTDEKLGSDYESDSDYVPDSDSEDEEYESDGDYEHVED